MKKLIISALLLITIGCTNSDVNENNNDQVSEVAVTPQNFKIIDEVKSETTGKAQLLEYAVYTDTIYTKAALEKIVMDIYNDNKDKHVFESHETATVIAVYLFTSIETYKDKADWIAMLIKSPSSDKPDISFNNYKITALNNLTDGVKSKDEIEYEKLTAYLEKRGLDLCKLSDLIKKAELDNIHKADAKHPDYGEEHMAMIDRLDAEFYLNLKRKHKISEEMLSKVWVFATSYCK
ncbi:MAG: hypothetical protein EOO90_01935 [Pedobacter sp.]|nr:MAG: hypothetical protein EOO90_01935 [Pedobacter sp.]